MGGCSSCSSLAGKDGKVSGCRNNGGCLTGGCNKRNVFDWLSNMDMPPEEVFNVLEVRFKNGRKEFFRNTHLKGLVTGDPVVVDVPNGHHIGYVSLQGELVRLQMKKRKVQDNDELRKVYRLASGKDLEKWQEVQNREMSTLYRTREIIHDLDLQMKLTDVEFQADNTKATFYYSADDRVDFRELIKILAGEFKIRVEMRQISLRQEAGRLGGIGSCGRELCCSTWLTDFKSVSTSAARYQNLSLNPSKLSGQCGRLKCCLNYELDTYMDALQDIPEVKVLKTEKGDAKLQKTDIFRKVMWFGFAEDSNWYPLPVSRVHEIIAMNKEGEMPATLGEEEEEIKLNEGTLFLNSDLDQLDSKYKSSKKRKKKKKKPGQGRPEQRNQSGTVAEGQKREGGNRSRSNNKRHSGNGPKANGSQPKPATASATDGAQKRESARSKSQSNRPKGPRGGAKPGAEASSEQKAPNSQARKRKNRRRKPSGGEGRNSKKANDKTND